MNEIQIPTKLTGFTPILDTMSSRYGLVGAAVFGVVWRHANMRNGVCSASQERMAELLGVNRMTVNKWIATLCDDGYLEDTTPDTKNRAHVYRVTGKAGLIQTIEAFDGGDTLNSTGDELGANLTSSSANLTSSTDSLNSTTANLVSTSRQFKRQKEEEVGEGAATAATSLLDDVTTYFTVEAGKRGLLVDVEQAKEAVEQWLYHVNEQGKGWRVKNYEAIAERYGMAELSQSRNGNGGNQDDNLDIKEYMVDMYDGLGPQPCYMDKHGRKYDEHGNLLVEPEAAQAEELF